MKMPFDDPIAIPKNPNDRELFGPTLLNELDENPGEDIIEKGLAFGIRGALAGAFFGASYAGYYDPPPNVNGLTYSLRHMGMRALIVGTAGMALGAGVPIAQAIRQKNDPLAWAMAGFATGGVFGLKSKRLGPVIRFGMIFAVAMATIKVTESYKVPFSDKYQNLRVPPKIHKYIQEDGSVDYSFKG